MKITIDIRLRNTRLAKALSKALEPDNKLAPSTLSVKTWSKKDTATTSITCRKSLETFIATIDDLLLCVDAAHKTLEDVETGKRA
jgi:hypothetical protein